MSNRNVQNAVGSFQPLMHGLEGRVMLSGNVSASVVDGNLVIRGNSDSNAIVMDQSGLTAGQVRVSSGTSATTINGAAGPLVLSGVKGVRATMGAGGDSVSADGLVLKRGISIDGGDGNNTVSLERATVEAGVNIKNASQVTLRKLKVAGKTNVVTTNRDATIKIDDSSFSAFSLQTGSGDDTVRVETDGSPTGSRSVFRGAAAISLGEGTDFLTVGIKQETGHHAAFQQSVRFNGGSQRDTLIYRDVRNLSSGSVASFETINPKIFTGVNLRTAAPFAILAGAGVSNTGGTIITGNLGTSPTGTVTGSPTVNGQTHAANPTAAQAKLDLTSAYNNAKGRAGTPTVSLPGELSGLTLAPGVYKNSSSVKLSSGHVTLDAKGNPDAVFIFQVGSTLTTISGTQIILAGGAKAANIYWQVGSSATLGTNSVFKGNILADQSITLKNGAGLEGRALARIGAVVLDSNIVTVPA